MIVVILVGVLGLWLAGNRHPAGWALAAGAHLLWLPWALGSRQYGFGLAVAAFGLVALRNYRNGQRHAGRLYPRRHPRSYRGSPVPVTCSSGVLAAWRHGTNRLSPPRPRST